MTIEEYVEQTLLSRVVQQALGELPDIALIFLAVHPSLGKRVQDCNIRLRFATALDRVGLHVPARDVWQRDYRKEEYLTANELRNPKYRRNLDLETSELPISYDVFYSEGNAALGLFLILLVG